ncbi:hypothetical protein [Hydrogenophaga sp. 2FB]|uniref:hypothetical protein n=1 Tax=Hydrogenophaga sp. 2FB TaxID=2502187 RepID=UPI0010F7D29B|nr:hypothetical protein [Hydrogenophaga sp. 2FB]
MSHVESTPLPSPAISTSTKVFESIFTREVYEAARAAWEAVDEAKMSAEAAEEARRTRRLHSDLLDQAVVAHLKVVREDGHLHAVQNVERRRFGWANAWNSLIARTEEPWSEERAAYPFSREISFGWLMNKTVKEGRTDYEGLLASLASGDFGAEIEQMADEPCSATGQRIGVLVYPGWRPVAASFSFGETWSDPLEIRPLPPTPLARVIEVAIPAPSGRMLLADWFRMDGNIFTSIVEEGKPSLSINTALGTQLQTEHFASRHGFLSVSVGNTSPRIVVRGDHLLLACVDEDCSEFEGDVRGGICTDLWQATMIDQEVLTKMIQSKLGEEEGLAAVRSFLDNPNTDITVLDIPPGTLHCSYTAEYGAMSTFECESTVVSLVGVDRLFATIHRSPQTWKPWDDANPPAPAPESPPSPIVRRRARR